jgi:hypothetical protein
MIKGMTIQIVLEKGIKTGEEFRQEQAVPQKQIDTARSVELHNGG